MKQIWVTACLFRGNCEDGGMFFTNEKNKTKQCNTMSRKQICRWEGLVWDWDDHIRNMSPLWCHKDQKKTAWNKEFRAIWSLELLPHRKNVYRSYKSIFYLQLMIQFYLFILIWWFTWTDLKTKLWKKIKYPVPGVSLGSWKEGSLTLYTNTWSRVCSNLWMCVFMPALQVLWE